MALPFTIFISWNCQSGVWELNVLEDNDVHVVNVDIRNACALSNPNDKGKYPHGIYWDLYIVMLYRSQVD